MASLYFKDLYPRARIQAYEADPEIASMCEANLRSFGHKNFSVEANKAVWVDDGGISFSNSKDDAGHVKPGKEDGLLVPSVRLKNLLAENTVHLLKLDVEGAEFDLINDCGETLRQVERMVIEVHILHAQTLGIGGLLNQIKTLGFRYVLHDLHHATWVDTDTPPPFAVCPTDKYIVTVFAWLP